MFLSEYETLFVNNIHEISLGVSEESFSLVNDLIKWIGIAAVKCKFMFKLTFMESVLSFSNPSLVTNAVFNCSHYLDSYESLEIIKNLSYYTNLRVLELSRGEFDIKDLELFPHLTSLKIRHLDSSNSKEVKFIPPITTFVVRNQDEYRFHLLPIALKDSFPGLKYLELNVRRGSRIDCDFSCLPSSCYLLKISSYLLENFRHCYHLKCLYLFYHGNVADGFYDFQYGNQLQISMLKICFSVRFSSQMLGLFSAISYIVKHWKHLKIFCIALSRKISSVVQSQSLEVQSFTDDAENLFTGEEHFQCEEFIRQLDVLKKLWVSSSVRLLILGQTVWMKKTTSSSLIEQADRMDALECTDGWHMRPRDATVFLFEDC